MIIRYSLDEFSSAKSLSKLKLECSFCFKEFFARKKDILSAINDPKRRNRLLYCGTICSHAVTKNRVLTLCAQCGTLVERKVTEKTKSKSGNSFCSCSCAAIYNHAHKTKGVRRSKLEQWLEQVLTAHYPLLTFIFNGKETINSELDIYIPSLRLAVELNGIFHYEPIYGSEKLTSIQNNDERKFQACLERGIELIIIDVSQEKKRFKPEHGKRFFEMISLIISKKLLRQEVQSRL